jgi:uncharacterized membrane protein YhaH (DUF805 family)
MIEATKTCFKNYATFNGRASRAEFWKFMLFVLLVSIILVIANSLIFGTTVEQGIRITTDSAGIQTTETYRRHLYNGGIFENIFILIVLLPWFAVTALRMHYISKSAWWAYYPWLLMVVSVTGILTATVGFSRVVGTFTGAGPVSVQFNSFFPTGFLILAILGTFIHVTVWLCTASHPGPNRFGPNPNEVPS